MAYSNADWAATLLSDAGLPQSENNIGNIMRWMTAEEPTNNWFDRNNPLNASLGTSASDGTGSYTDLNQGAAYTALMLKQQNMSGIYNALASNASASSFSAAVVASPWASSHYGGNPLHIAQIPVPSGVNAPTGVTPGVVTVTPPAGGAVGSAGSAVAASGPYSGISLPLVGQVISGSQEMVIKGWFFIIAGGIVATVGAGVLLTAFGLESRVGRAIVGATPVGRLSRGARGAGAAAGAAQEPPSAPAPPTAARAYQEGQRRGVEAGSATRDQELSGAYNRGVEDAGGATRRTKGPSVAGARPRPRPGSRERRERAAQSF